MRIIIILTFIGAALYTIAHLIADKIIFRPQHPAYCEGCHSLTLRGTVGDIAAVHLPHPTARYTILYHHGNASDLGDILWVLQKLRDLGFAVFSYDYPGYGKSAGSPSERGLYAAADTAYRHLTETLNIAPHNIIAYGHSLGGAVAVDLASRQLLAGLIVEGSFVTAFRVATRWAISPFDKFRSVHKIKTVRCPILILHGRQDDVIRLWHGQQLFASAPEPKRAAWIEGAGHNDLIAVAGPQFDAALSEFHELLDGVAEE